MQEWWNNLEVFDKVIWLIAAATSLVFIIQTILTFTGMDADGGLDADFDGDMAAGHDGAPFQLFTFRNFINFFLGFSWTVIALRGVIPNLTVLTLVGSIAGVLLVTAVMYLFYFMFRMAQSGTLNIRDAVGLSAEVYLTIPEKGNGLGKIHIKVAGTLRELDAITRGDALPSGSMVKVIGIVEDRILEVEKWS